MNIASDSKDDSYELVGGPFSVVESDPGVFTDLIRNLGVEGVEFEEIYDIQWSLENIRPRGLILCFNWRGDNHHVRDFNDPAAKDVWFANQLEADACASLAIVNILTNCSDIRLGSELENFRREVSQMSSKMKGLAISNLRCIREAQNILARPADIRGSEHYFAQQARDELEGSKKPAKKRIRFDEERAKSAQKRQQELDAAETFHFIGYVPAHGKVWELDGLKAGPLEVGELSDPGSKDDWVEVVRPALKLKMEKCGSMDAFNPNIRFNLLALVDSTYEAKSDRFKLFLKERQALEERLSMTLEESWREVDDDLLKDADALLAKNGCAGRSEHAFSQDFSLRWQSRKRDILDLPETNLLPAWERSLTEVKRAKRDVDDELEKARNIRTENVKRTHDYEPFIHGFLEALHFEGLLANCIAAAKV